MVRSIARWLVITCVIFLVASMVVFALSNLPPGDPALDLLGHQPWVEEARALNRDLGPDRPYAVRYAIWLGRVVRRLYERLRTRHVLSCVPDGAKVDPEA